MRKIVHLMGLVAGGRVEAGPSKSSCASSLTCLTTCLTAVAHSDPTASKVIILMCAQVCI